MRLVILLLTFLGVVSPLSHGQYQSTLTTTYTGTNGCYGNLFDIQALVDITLCSFDVNLDAGESTIQVWVVTGGGSWNQPGVTGNAGAWTLLDQVTVNGQGLGLPTPLNFRLAYPIASGTTQGIAIQKTVNVAPILRYSNGTAYGSTLASSSDLIVMGGGGLCGGVFTPNAPRDWNGTVYYEVGFQPACILGTPPREYQLNSPGAFMTVNGLVPPGPNGPVAITALAGTPAMLTLDSVNVGNPWEIGTAFAPTVGFSTLGLASAGGQTVNVDITALTFGYLFGGATPNLTSTSFPAGPLNLPFMIPFPTTASAQFLILDATFIDGFSLSHAARYIAQ